MHCTTKKETLQKLSDILLMKNAAGYHQITLSQIKYTMWIISGMHVYFHRVSDQVDDDLTKSARVTDEDTWNLL